MTKYEYRCNRCLIIEEKWYSKSYDPADSVPCQKCGGLALRIPWSKLDEVTFENSEKNWDSSN